VGQWRELAEALGAEAAARVLILWGPDEVHMARQIAAHLSAPAVLAPPTDLDELTALLRRCSLLVAADTGPLHLAAAAGTACVGLYGPTRSARNGPYGPRCRGVESPDGTMAGLPPADVLRVAQDLLDQSRT
jgi:ADP-heptose:LPS heptosyltransferase